MANVLRDSHSQNHDVWIGRHVTGGSSSLSAPSLTARPRDPGLGKPASRYPSGIRSFPVWSVSRSRSSGHHCLTERCASAAELCEVRWRRWLASAFVSAFLPGGARSVSVRVRSVSVRVPGNARRLSRESIDLERIDGIERLIGRRAQTPGRSGSVLSQLLFSRATGLPGRAHFLRSAKRCSQHRALHRSPWYIPCART